MPSNRGVRWTGKPFLRSAKCLPVLLFLLLTHGAEGQTGWKTTIEFPADPFISEPIGGLRVGFVKFTILTNDPGTVLFQDSHNYRFHYEFAVAELDGYASVTRQEFDELTLYPGDGQTAILGTLALPRYEDEFAFEVLGYTPYPADEVIRIYNLLAAAVSGIESSKGYYFPAVGQVEAAEGYADQLTAAGLNLGNIGRWEITNPVSSSGWALGRLRFVPSTEINEAYLEGRLHPEDILLTDRIPNDIPAVSGILSLSPPTPNSHVLLLARNIGIPIVYVSADESEDPFYQNPTAGEVNSFVDRDIYFEAKAGSRYFRVDPVDANLTVADRETIMARGIPQPLAIPSIRESGVYAIDLDSLGPTNIDQVGGKTANYGLLRNTTPEMVRPGIALTFDLWNEYLEQVLSTTGKSLRNTIADRLAPYSWPPDMASLSADLRAIRDTIEDEADFNGSQRAAILEALIDAGFQEDAKIRFRSSTNVEDSGQFTGAGLYDSYSGCFADDLDADETGPSRCDPGKDSERGVFRAIRKVYASFYNFPAFLERLRHDVDESQVGMAVLVHHSFPDEIEWANGVGLAEYWFRPEIEESLEGSLVTQVGANPVANPEWEFIAEEVAFRDRRPIESIDRQNFYIHTRSSLLPFGEDSVLTWEDDYNTLVDGFFDVARAWKEQFPEENRFTLDFEYKKIEPGELVLKQVRPVPSPEALAGPVFLMNHPTRLEIQQQQGSLYSLFTHHRLKSVFEIETVNRLLETESIDSSLLRSVTLQSQVAGERFVRSGAPVEWPDAEFAVEGTGFVAVYRWSDNTPLGRVTYSLRMGLPSSSTTSSVYVPERCQFALRANYESLPIHPFAGFEDRFSSLPWDPDDPWQPGDPWEEEVRPTVSLAQDAPPPPWVELKTYIVSRGALKITSRIYHVSKTADGIFIDLPFWRFLDTRIEGLSDEPIVFDDYFAQTLVLYHHAGAGLLFEPGLDPDLTEEERSLLASLDVKQLVTWGFPGASLLASNIHAIGKNDIARPFYGSHPGDIYWQGPVDLGGDWRRTEWFGDIYLGAFPWIWSAWHGWLYCAGPGGEQLWLWDPHPSVGWLCAFPEYPGYFWNVPDQSWWYYLPESRSPRWFYRMRTEEWSTND